MFKAADQGTPADPEPMAPQLRFSEEGEQAITTALAKDPEDRFAGAIAQQLSPVDYGKWKRARQAHGPPP
jgi:hypothetical protein